MEPIDFKRFVQCMMGLAEIFEGELSEPRILIYFDALEDYTIDEVEAAAMATIRTRKYTKMPTPAELIEHIKEPIEDKGEMQSEHVLKVIRSKGCNSGHVFEDAVTQAVIDQRFGGLSGLHTLQDKDIHWFVTQFRQAYAVRARHRDRIHEPAVTGGTSARIEEMTKRIGTVSDDAESE